MMVKTGIQHVLVAGALGWVCVSSTLANDWPSWRGPEQTGLSREKAVVTSWSQDGENLLWKSPVGGRSTPVLMDGRLFVIGPVGSGECLGERVVCLDAHTGRTIWEHRFNVFHTDIVEVRLGWTSVVGDPETGNIYAHGTGGEFFCFSRDGEVLWKHSLGEEFGRYSGYGGRLHSPVVDEGRVILSYVYILSNWGTGKRKAGHRYLAFDKRTGEVLWSSQPGGRPFDTTYSRPVVTVIDGKRMLIAGNADGGVHAMFARTGEPIWSFKASKRGLNSSVVVDGKYVYLTHSEENLQGTVMGSVICLDATGSGDITNSGVVWRVDGILAGYASPAIAHHRLYVVTNSATMICLDAKTGKQHWEFALGRVMKGSPTITEDGVIYAGEVNGRFWILKDAGDHCERLDEDKFTREDGAVVELNGSPIISNGRVYFMTTYGTYALGKKTQSPMQVAIPPMAAEAEPDPARPAFLQLVPADVTLAPGERIQFRAVLFDDNGRYLFPADAAWSSSGVQGRFHGRGQFIAATANRYSAGAVLGQVEGVTAAVRVRVMPSMNIHETFEGMTEGQPPPGWIGVDLKTKVVKQGDNMVLEKLAAKPSAPYARMRAFTGKPQPANYTVQADIMARPRVGRRPILSDMGLINSRYKLIMLGYEKQLRVVSYSPIPRLQKDVPFAWNGDVWYRAKLRVDLQGDQALVQGKVWPRDQEEPADWMIEVVDSCPNREGSPGLYAYSKGTTAKKQGS